MNDLSRRLPPVLTPEQLKSRRARNIAIGLAVGALVVLFYAVTIVKLAGVAGGGAG